MTLLYKLMFLMTINGEAHPISMQEELTQAMCAEQVKQLSGTQFLIKEGMKENKGHYFCIPQRLTGV